MISKQEASINNKTLRRELIRGDAPNITEAVTVVYYFWHHCRRAVIHALQ